METHRQGTTLFTAICVLIGLLVVIQLWLVAACLDALRAGDTGVLAAAAAASLVILSLNVGLLLYVVAFDARVRHMQGPPRE